MSLKKMSRRSFASVAATATVVAPLSISAVGHSKEQGAPGTTALNLTLPIKQDPMTQAQLKALKDNFATAIQPKIDKALRESKLVHFARVLVIDNKYIQVLTEFDGDKRAYTDFFLEALPDVFKAVFGLAEGAPSWNALQDSDTFFKFSSKANLRALGTKDDDPEAGYLFCAYPGKSVQQILAKFGT